LKFGEAVNPDEEWFGFVTEAVIAHPLSLRGGSLPFFGSQEVGFSVP
jgi:hypothetical protein